MYCTRSRLGATQALPGKSWGVGQALDQEIALSTPPRPSANTPPPPLVLTRACPNTVTPCFRTFGPVFGTIVFAVPMQLRMWFVALCRQQGGSILVARRLPVVGCRSNPPPQRLWRAFGIGQRGCDSLQGAPVPLFGRGGGTVVSLLYRAMVSTDQCAAPLGYHFCEPIPHMPVDGGLPSYCRFWCFGVAREMFPVCGAGVYRGTHGGERNWTHAPSMYWGLQTSGGGGGV